MKCDVKVSVRVQIDQDFSTLGPAATAEDLEIYRMNLESFLDDAFPEGDFHVATGPGHRGVVLCGDDDLTERVDDRLHDLQGSDEWIGLLARTE